MVRRVINIDEEKCNGCGKCADACHEGAIAIVDGKAKLMRDDYCDGLGDCLPNCPAGAITFVEREAAAYDEAAVLEHKKAKAAAGEPVKAGCPGSRSRVLKRDDAPAAGCPGTRMRSMQRDPAPAPSGEVSLQSELRQWPVQIKLAPLKAPYFDGAHLLIAADCTAYAYANFHRDFIRGKVTLIGCPKLDAVQYSEKLTEIIRQNDIRSVTVVRMEVPCCGGLEQAAVTALKNSGKFIPWGVTTITIDGHIKEN